MSVDVHNMKALNHIHVTVLTEIIQAQWQVISVSDVSAVSGCHSVVYEVPTSALSIPMKSFYSKQNRKTLRSGVTVATALWTQLFTIIRRRVCVVK